MFQIFPVIITSKQNNVLTNNNKTLTTQARTNEIAKLTAGSLDNGIIVPFFVVLEHYQRKLEEVVQEYQLCRTHCKDSMQLCNINNVFILTN